VKFVYAAFDQKLALELILYDSTSQRQSKTLRFQAFEELIEMARRGGRYRIWKRNKPSNTASSRVKIARS
jgi:hypothetical protein